MATPYKAKKSGYTYKYAEFTNSNKNFRIYLAYQTSQSTTNNTTTVSMEMGLYSVTEWAQQTWSSGGSLKCQMIVGSSTYGVTGSGYDLRSHGIGYHFPSLSYSKTFKHDNDGTHDSIKLYAYCNTVTGQGSSSITVTYTPTTIPRASSLSVASSATMGSDLNLTISRNSSNFRHTLTYSCGSVSGTIIAKSYKDTSFTWKVPDLSEQCPTANSITCKFYLKTYGSATSTTQIGSTVTKSVKLNVPSGNPTISSVSITPNTDYTSVFGSKYVQNRSNATITVEAKAKYSATIKSYKITANGASSTTKTLNTGTLKKAGETYPIRIEVTDSRGRTTVDTSHAVASATGTNSVCAYSPPVISSFSVKRCTVSGSTVTLDDSGEYACVSYNTSVTKDVCEPTKISYTLKFPGNTSGKTLGNPSNKDLLITDTDGNAIPFDTETQHKFTLEVQDYFYTPTKCIKKEVTLGTVFVLVDLHYEGNGLAIGKVAENANQLDVNLPSLFRKNIDFTNGQGVRTPLSDGTDTNLITRNSSNNVWIGDAVGENQGNVYLSTKTGGYALVCRNQVRTKILDYGFVGKTIWTGSLLIGNSITLPEVNDYTLFMMASGTNTTPYYLLKNGTRLAGGGLFGSGAKTWVMAFQFTISGNTLTFNAYDRFTVGQASGAIGDLTIAADTAMTKIIGIV